MRVGKLMHKGVATVIPSAKLPAIARIMRDKDIGIVVVKDDKRLLGVVTDRDITCRGLANGRDMSELTAADVMSKNVAYCDVSDKVADAVKLLRKKKIRRLAVRDGKNQVAGIVGLGDLAAFLKPKQSKDLLRAVTKHHTS